MVAFNSTSPRPAWTVLEESISDAAHSQTPSTMVDELAHDGSPSSPSRLESSRSRQKLARQLVVRRRHVQRNATPGPSSQRLDDLQRRRSIISPRPKPTPRKKTKTSDSEGSSESDLPFSPLSRIMSPTRPQKCHKTIENSAIVSIGIVELSDSEEDRAPVKRRKIDSRSKNSAPAQRLGVIDLCSDGGSSPAPTNKVLSGEVINLVSDDDQSDSFRLVEQELLGTGDSHAASFSDTSFGAVDDLDPDDAPPLAEDVIPREDAHDSAFPDLRQPHDLSSPPVKLLEDCDRLKSTPTIQKVTMHASERSSAHTKSLSIDTAGVSSDDAITLAHTSPLLPPTPPTQLQSAEDVSTVDDSKEAELPKSPCQSPLPMGDQGRQLTQPQEDEGHSCTQLQAPVIPGKVVDPDATLISIVSTKGLDQDLEDDDYLLSTFSLCYPVES